MEDDKNENRYTFYNILASSSNVNKHFLKICDHCSFFHGPLTRRQMGEKLLAHQCFQFRFRPALRINRLPQVHVNLSRARLYREEGIGRHDRVRIRQRNGNNGYLRLDGQGEEALFEGPEATVVGAHAFRKGHDRHAPFQPGPAVFEGAQLRFAVVAIN
jgi:hypothetical protein